MMEQSTGDYSGVGVVIVVIAFLLLARRKPAVAMAPAMSAACSPWCWRCSAGAGAPYGGGTRAEPEAIAPLDMAERSYGSIQVIFRFAVW